MSEMCEHCYQAIEKAEYGLQERCNILSPLIAGTVHFTFLREMGPVTTDISNQVILDGLVRIVRDYHQCRRILKDSR